MLNKKLVTALSTVLSLIILFTNVEATETAYVNCDALNVRTQPNTSCEIVDVLWYGTPFEIIYTDNGWYNIRMSNGITGFVSAAYVTKEMEQELGLKGKEVAKTVQNYVGRPYVYGSAGPNSFDCSGLTSYVYRQFGISLPRSSNAQGSVGTYVDKANLREGDLLFFSNRSDRKINHVGIYIGNNEFVHASTSVRGVVRDNLNTNYYVRNYVTARRIA